MFDQTDLALLISGFGDDGVGGLFEFDGAEVSRIDPVCTTGLCSTDGKVGRLVQAVAEGGAELLVYDSTGVLDYRRLDAVGDPHDLARLADGSWLLVSSEENAVLRLDPDGTLSTLWQPSSVSDSWHPNCVAVVDGDVWVMAFGRFGERRGWEAGRGMGTGFLRNLSTEEEIGGLSFPHSPRWVANHWIVCNSLAGEVVTYDPDLGRWNPMVSGLSYPRGLAVDGSTLFVGESGKRGTPAHRASLAVVEDGTVVDRLGLPCAEIYDVVFAPRKMLRGLRRGFDTNSQRMASVASSGMLGMGGPGQGGLAFGSPLDPQTTAVRVECDPPTTMSRSGEVPLEVTVANIGATTLTSSLPHQVFVSYRWVDGTGGQIDGPRAHLSQILSPGDAVSVQVQLRAPSVPGEFGLSVSLVEEGIRWLDEIDSSNGVHVRVQIT